jgi:hypothetical protein
MSFLFVDNRVIISNNEYNLYKYLYELSKISEQYNVKISGVKNKVLVFQGKRSIRPKVIMDNIPTEQVNKFKFLGCILSHYEDLD